LPSSIAVAGENAAKAFAASVADFNHLTPVYLEMTPGPGIKSIDPGRTAEVQY
jgi:hypothetical protein